MTADTATESYWKSMYDELVRQRQVVDLNALATKCHVTAVEKGFYEPIDSTYLNRSLQLMLTISDTIDVLTALRKNVDLPDPLDVKGSSLSEEQLNAVIRYLLIISEVDETFRAVCLGDGDEADEVADILIRVLNYGAWRGIDLNAALVAKMAKNAERPRKHNCNF